MCIILLYFCLLRKQYIIYFMRPIVKCLEGVFRFDSFSFVFKAMGLRTHSQSSYKCR